jgi:hypothetical protein
MLFLLAILLSSAGCGRPAKENTQLARINNYEITKEEFERAFKDSAFGRADTLESRREFLDNLINQKLILQEAQAGGLDKDKDFLKLIERFWEQSLLKIALDRKTKEVSGAVFVSDKAIEEVYNKMAGEGKADRPYAKMYSQIKWELARAGQSKMMDNWVSSLRKKADIKINQEMLK